VRAKPNGSKYRNLTETDLEERVRRQRMGLAAEWSAALLLLLWLIGVFQHSDRVDLYESLVQFEAVDVPVQSTVVRDLLRDFGVPDDHIDLFAKLRTRSVMASGDRILEGEVVAWTEDGQSKTLGTIEEVREWAYAESRFYLWTSFALLMFGLVIRTAAAARVKK
jgi:hypothetical protein